MKPVCWHGRNDVRVDMIPDPNIEDDRKAIIRHSATGICGSDLHLLAGAAASMLAGDVIGYAGGQAELLRGPFADLAPIKVPDDLTDEQAFYLPDLFPTG